MLNLGGYQVLASVVYSGWYVHSSFLKKPGPNQSRHIQEIPSVSSCDHLCSIFEVSNGLKYLLTKVHSSETKTWQQLSPLQDTLKETCYSCFEPPKSCVVDCFCFPFFKAHVIGMAMPFVHVGVVCVLAGLLTAILAPLEQVGGAGTNVFV